MNQLQSDGKNRGEEGNECIWWEEKAESGQTALLYSKHYLGLWADNSSNLEL